MNLRRVLAAATMLPLITITLAVPAQASSGAPSDEGIIGNWTTSTDGVRQTVTFARSGRISGDSGCNRFIGEYGIDGSVVEVGELASTMMYCEGAMEAERSLLRALQKSVSFSVKGERLTLFGPRGRVTVRLTAS